jgi:N-acetylglucosaminyl-diphospho-decaprenol L-rhamnosyltransferase
MKSKTLQLKLSILIVSYNTANLTLQTLESVLASLEQTPELLKQSEVIVVDNNSSDDSVKKIKQFKKNNSKNLNLTLIENSDNKGFGVANNQAAQKATGKYLLLLNSDTIVQADALQKLVTTMEQQPQLGIGAAKLLNKDGSIQYQGGDLPSLRALIGHYLFFKNLPLIGKLFTSTQLTGKKAQPQTYNQPLVYLGWVGGTTLTISKDLYQKLGMLDEKIFMYGEDVELCLRNHLAGFKTAIITNAEITHLGSASSSSQNAIAGEIKGYLYIFKKHFSKFKYQLAKLIIKTGVILRVWLFGKILNDEKKGQIYQTILEKDF